MAEHNLPWAYRPHEFDDWGWIRDAAGNLAACARGEKDDKSHDAHRADKTDPYGENAALIVRAVNNHEALVETLQEARLQIEYLHERFKPTGTSEAVLARIYDVLGDVGGARD